MNQLDELLDILQASQADTEYMGQGLRCDARLERAKRAREILREHGRDVPEPGLYLRDIFLRTHNIDDRGRKGGVWLLTRGEGIGEYCLLLNMDLHVLRHGARGWVLEEARIHGMKVTQEFRVDRPYQEAIFKPDAVEHYPLAACVWKRDSTDEWVLELSGVVRDTALNSRQTAPSTTNPEDVPGMLHTFALLHEAQDFLGNLVGVIDTPVARRKLNDEHSNEVREQLRSLKARLDELL